MFAPTSSTVRPGLIEEQNISRSCFSYSSGKCHKLMPTSPRTFTSKIMSSSKLLIRTRKSSGMILRYNQSNRVKPLQLGEYLVMRPAFRKSKRVARMNRDPVEVFGVVLWPSSSSKDILIVPVPTTYGPQLCQLKPFCSRNIQDSFWFCRLKRVAAKPIEQVSKIRHSPQLLVLFIPTQRIFAEDQDILQEPPCDEAGAKNEDDRQAPNKSSAVTP